MSFEKITESDSYYNDLEYKSTEEIIKIINAEDKTVAHSVEKVLPKIEILINTKKEKREIEDISITNWSKLALENVDLYMQYNVKGIVTKKTYTPLTRCIIDMIADKGSLILVRSR